MEIKNENGKLKTLDQLFDEAVDMMVEVLDDLSTEEQLDIGNEYRDKNSYATLYENMESNLNDILEGMDPADLLRMGHEDWDDYSDFFTYDYDLNMTDDVWYDIEEDDLARELLSDTFRPRYLPSEVRDLIDEYEEAKEEIENYNPNKAMVEEVIKRYVNCEADVTDLLQTLDKLARNDELWEE